MNGCLTCLAYEYPTVKFCKIKATDAKTTANFVSIRTSECCRISQATKFPIQFHTPFTILLRLQAKQGVPALLIYKNKEIIANFVRMSDEFGDDFYASDVENFLQE